MEKFTLKGFQQFSRFRTYKAMNECFEYWYSVTLFELIGYEFPDLAFFYCVLKPGEFMEVVRMEKFWKGCYLLN